MVSSSFVLLRTASPSLCYAGNGLYKAEVIHRLGPWRNIEAVEFATLEWVDGFNHRRLLEPIGNIPPAEAEATFYAALEQPAMAAYLKPNSIRNSRRGSSHLYGRLIGEVVSVLPA